MRRAARKRLVDVLDRLDEVGLPEDEVDVVGLLDRNGEQLHQILPWLSGLVMHPTATAGSVAIWVSLPSTDNVRGETVAGTRSLRPLPECDSSGRGAVHTEARAPRYEPAQSLGKRLVGPDDERSSWPEGEGE